MTKDVKFALLRKEKKGENRDLELIVTYNNLESRNSRYEVIGNIKLETSLSSEKLIKDFSEKYVGRVSWYEPPKGHPASGVIYPSSFEPTIAPAFVDYFSKLNSKP